MSSVQANSKLNTSATPNLAILNIEYPFFSVTRCCFSQG
jgi:hypothetical protein